METPCKGLTIPEIIAVNRQVTGKYGGRHGFLSRESLGSLEHTLVQLQGSLYGEPLYPTLIAKAAFLCIRLAQGHFFLDGNKRTAFECCKIMLQLNGLHLIIDHADVVDRMVAIAEKRMDLSDVERWLSDMLS